MRYLLDTNIFIAAMKGVETVQQRLEATPLSALGLSPVVLGELELGFEESVQREKNAARLQGVVATLELVALDDRVSRHDAAIRADLERKGTPIRANDDWIAAQGLALGAVVVTDNEYEFNRVSGLLVDNWRRPGGVGEDAD